MAKWQARQVQLACFSSKLERQSATQLFADFTGETPTGTQTMQMQGPFGSVPFEQAQGSWNGLSAVVQKQGPRVDFLFQPGTASAPNVIPLIDDVPAAIARVEQSGLRVLPSLTNLNRIGLVTVLTKVAPSVKEANANIVDILGLRNTPYAAAIDLQFRANIRSREIDTIINHTYLWQVETFQNLFISHAFGPAISTSTPEPTYAASLSLDFNTVPLEDASLAFDTSALLRILAKDTLEAWAIGKPTGVI